MLTLAIAVIMFIINLLTCVSLFAADNQPGYYRNALNETQALPCPIGTYQPDKWQYSCVSCGGDRYRTDSMASTSPSDCKCK